MATKTVTEGKRDEVLALRAKHHDMSLSEIGLRVGITRQRVHQILYGRPEREIAPRVTMTCDHCGCKFEVRQSKYDLDTANGKRFWFCSRKCLGPGMIGRAHHSKPEQVNQMPSRTSRSASVAQLDAKYKAKGLHLCPDGQPHRWVLEELTVDGLYPGRCERCGAERRHGGGEPWA